MYVNELRVDTTDAEAVADAIAISSNSRHVAPVSDEIQIHTVEAVDAPLMFNFASISNTFVPAATPAIRVPIVPTGSCKFAVATLIEASLGVEMNDGCDAMIDVLSDERSVSENE